jgi:hypothetical protein
MSDGADGVEPKESLDRVRKQMKSEGSEQNPISPSLSSSISSSISLVVNQVMEQRMCPVCRSLVTTRQIVSDSATRCGVCLMWMHDTCFADSRCSMCRADSNKWGNAGGITVPALEAILSHPCEYCGVIHTGIDAIEHHHSICQHAEATCEMPMCSFSAPRHDITAFLQHHADKHSCSTYCLGGRRSVRLLEDHSAPYTIVMEIIHEIARPYPSTELSAVVLVYVTNGNINVQVIGDFNVANSVWMMVGRSKDTSCESLGYEKLEYGATTFIESCKRGIVLTIGTDSVIKYETVKMANSMIHAKFVMDNVDDGLIAWGEQYHSVATAKWIPDTIRTMMMTLNVAVDPGPEPRAIEPFPGLVDVKSILNMIPLGFENSDNDE